MAEEGLHKVETYVSYRQNIVAKYISTRPIMDLCLAGKQRLGPRAEMRWWEQEGFVFGGDTDGSPGGGVDGGGREDGWDGDCDGRLVKWGGYYSNHNLRDRS